MKPKPPADLWEQMDAVRQEVLKSVTPPPGSFSVQDYCQKYGVCVSTAHCQIARLVHAGKLKVVGRQRKKAFYAPN